MAWKFSGFGGGCVPLAAVLLSIGAVVTLLDFSQAGLTMELLQTRLDGASSLDDGAVPAQARWRRAVLAIVLSESRIDGEQKEGAGDGVH